MVAPASVPTAERPIARPSSRATRRSSSPEMSSHRVTTGSRRPEPVDSAVIEGSTLLAMAGPVGTIVAAVGFSAVAMSGRADSALGVVVAPVMAVLVYVVLTRTVQTAHGRGFVAIVFAGFGARLVASVPRLLGGVDSVAYQSEGVRLAEHFRVLDFGVSTGRPIPGTGSIRYLTGIVNVLTSSNFVSTYLVFATLAFAGQVIFLVGIRPVLNVRQFRVLTLLVMLWPSLAFWPSSIGKEAVVLLGLGLTTHGAVRLYLRTATRAGSLLVGLLVIGLVRPHVAMIVLAAVVVGLFARDRAAGPRSVVHAIALCSAVVVAMWLTDASATLFGLEQLDGFGDLRAALDFAEQRTSQDQAAFAAPRVDSAAAYPLAFVTVLFRPFPWEVSGMAPIVSSFEGVMLLMLVVAAVPGLAAQSRRLLTSGPLVHTFTFLLVFVFLFSAIGNFGILTRQRVQVLPFVLLFVALGIGHRPGADSASRRLITLGHGGRR